jgi:hypothetical protein
VSPDRYGEIAEDPEPVQHDPRCRKGWLPPFDADVRVPCLVCKPHLAPDRRVQRVGE